jgi:hypothetical protein
MSSEGAGVDADADVDDFFFFLSFSDLKGSGLIEVESSASIMETSSFGADKIELFFLSFVDFLLVLVPLSTTSAAAVSDNRFFFSFFALFSTTSIAITSSLAAAAAAFSLRNLLSSTSLSLSSDEETLKLVSAMFSSINRTLTLSPALFILRSLALLHVWGILERHVVVS